MLDPRLPITVKRIPGGFRIHTANGLSFSIYGRDKSVALAAKTMTLEEAEQLAKDVARALTEPWSDQPK